MSSDLSIERLTVEANRTSPLSIVAVLLMLIGVSAVVVSAVLWASLAGDASDSYAYDLAARDSAPSGDSLLENQNTLADFSMWLPSLAILGIALILSAIGILLRTFVRRIRLRMVVTTIALPALRDRRPGSDRG